MHLLNSFAVNKYMEFYTTRRKHPRQSIILNAMGFTHIILETQVNPSAAFLYQN